MFCNYVGIFLLHHFNIKYCFTDECCIDMYKGRTFFPQSWWATAPYTGSGKLVEFFSLWIVNKLYSFASKCYPFHNEWMHGWINELIHSFTHTLYNWPRFSHAAHYSSSHLLMKSPFVPPTALKKSITSKLAQLYIWRQFIATLVSSWIQRERVKCTFNSYLEFADRNIRRYSE